MDPSLNVGRWIGAAMLVDFAVGLVSNFKLQGDLFAAEGFLGNAAAHPVTIGWIIVLGLFTGMLSVWVAALLCQRFGRVHPVLAWTYFGLAAALLAVTLVELSTLLVMRSLSEVYVASGSSGGPHVETAKAVVRGLRNGLHFGDQVLGGASVFAFFLLLFRARAVPAWLSGFGMLGALLQMAGVGPELFGGEVSYPMLAPLALAYAATFVWLLIRGFPASD